MKKILLWLLIFAILFSLCACAKDEPTNTPDSSDPSASEQGGTVDFLYRDANGKIKCDYVIVYDINDSDAEAKANLIRKTIQELCDVSLDTYYNVEEPHEREILIGKFSREERPATADAKEELGFANDFILRLSGDDIVMLYTDTAAFELLVTAFAERWIIPNFSNEILKFSASLNLNRSTYQALTPTWSALDLLDSYKIVYERENSAQKTAAQYLQAAIKGKFGVNLDVVADGKRYSKEIVLGNTADRYQTACKSLLLSGTHGDFLFAPSENRCVLTSKTNDGLFRAVLWFIETYVTANTTGKLTVTPTDGYTYSKAGDWNLPDGYVSLYCKTFGTYHSQYDAYIYGNWGGGEIHSVPQAAKDDQRMIQTMKARLGDAAVFYVGETMALYQKYYIPLNSADYSQAARLGDGDLFIPAEFAKKLLGDNVSATDGYVNLSAFAASNANYMLYHYGSTPLYVLVPSSVTAFDDLNKTYADIDCRVSATYTEKQFLDRLVQFYTDPIFDPDSVVCDAEQSREVIVEYPYSKDVVNYVGYTFTAAASPSLLITEENGETVYWTAHEKSTIQKGIAGQPEETKTETVVMRRKKNESAWTVVATVKGLRWGSLFELNGNIYVLGSDLSTYAVMLAKIEKTASGWKSESFSLMQNSQSEHGGCGPNTVLINGGYLYKAYNNRVVYASVTDDLTKPASWKTSQDIYEAMGEGWLKQQTGKDSLTLEEGEIIQKGTQLYVLYRFSGAKSAPLNHAVLAELSWEADSLRLKNPQYIEIPTTLTKFNVAYDEMTRMFYAITATHQASHDSTRINLALLYSEDLLNWSNAGNLLVEREMMNEYAAAQAHGFNYAHFAIDGNDLVFVVREAYGDTAQWWHEGNYFTMYTVANFRNLIA